MFFEKHLRAIWKTGTRSEHTFFYCKFRKITNNKNKFIRMISKRTHKVMLFTKFSTNNERKQNCVCVGEVGRRLTG